MSCDRCPRCPETSQRWAERESNPHSQRRLIYSQRSSPHCSICPRAVRLSLVDDRAVRVAVLLAGHIIFLSAGALRIIRGLRAHVLVTRAPWWIQYYPPLVCLPFLVAYARPFAIDLGTSVQYA